MISFGLPRKDVVQIVCDSYDELPETARDGTIGRIRVDGGEDAYVYWGGAWNSVDGGSDQGDVPVEMMVFEVVEGEASLVGISEDYVVPEGGYRLVVPAEYQGAPVMAIVGPNLESEGEPVSPYTGCKSLSSQSAVGVATGAFYRCELLASVSLPAAIDIGIGAFAGCTALASVSLPAVRIIRTSAFNGCTALASVSLPSITLIDDYAFEGCTSAERVKFGPLADLGIGPFSDWEFFDGNGNMLDMTDAASLANKTFSVADGTLVVTSTPPPGPPSDEIAS